MSGRKGKHMYYIHRGSPGKKSECPNPERSRSPHTLFPGKKSEISKPSEVWKPTHPLPRERRAGSLGRVNDLGEGDWVMPVTESAWMSCGPQVSPG